MDKPLIDVPNRPKPTYAEVCRSKFAYCLPFDVCKMRFWKTHSKNYKTAIYICSLFPEHELASARNNYCNSVTINTEFEFYTYSEAIFELYTMISKWTYIDFHIGKEPCYSDEFYLYIHHLNDCITFNSKKLDIKEKIKIHQNRWSNERTLFEIIRDLFPDETIFFHYRPKWLYNLELDIYINDYNLGIEYQGIQHFKPLAHWGGEKGFIERRLHDLQKKSLCAQNKVSLVYFYFNENITYDLVIERLLPYI